MVVYCDNRNEYITQVPTSQKPHRIPVTKISRLIFWETLFHRITVELFNILGIDRFVTQECTAWAECPVTEC